MKFKDKFKFIMIAYAIYKELRDLMSDESFAEFKEALAKVVDKLETITDGTATEIDDKVIDFIQKFVGDPTPE